MYRFPPVTIQSSCWRICGAVSLIKLKLKHTVLDLTIELHIAHKKAS